MIPSPRKAINKQEDKGIRIIMDVLCRIGFFWSLMLINILDTIPDQENHAVNNKPSGIPFKPPLSRGNSNSNIPSC